MKKYNEDFLKQVFAHSEKYPFTVDEDGIVTVLEPQEHLIQRVFRKIGAKIPEHRKMELDEYGSFVYLQIDGEKSVEEIGEALKERYEEAGQQLYERLCTYLEALCKQYHYIRVVSQEK